MTQQLRRDTKKKLQSEKIEIFGSYNLYEEEKERIVSLYNHYYNEDSIEAFIEEKYIEENRKYEPYRTQLTLINFLTINLLELFLYAPKYELTTTEINQIDTENIIENYVIYLEYVERLKIKHSSLSPASILKKIKSAKETFEDSRKKRDLIHKSLKYLVSYNIIEFIEIKGLTHNTYKLNLKSWMERQNYFLNNDNIIQDLLPLLVSFIKYNYPNKVDNFLDIIDNIVDFLFTTPKNYSKYYKIENYIVNANLEKENITFEIFDKEIASKFNGKMLFEDIEIIQIQITDNKKILIFKDIDNNTIVDIPIEKIYRIRVDKDYEDSIELKSEDCYVIYNDMYSQDIKNKKYTQTTKEHNIILELDMNMLDYLEIKPFKKQTIYKTEHDKMMLFKIEDISNYQNKFYVKATDTKDKIFDIVQRNMPYIKILEPNDLNIELNKILTKYLKTTAR